MAKVRLNSEPTPTRRDVENDGEHPDAIIADILRRPRPKARIIVVANEKGGVGKSTIAFHLCVTLAERGYKVAAVDLDRRQQTLGRVLTHRDATARRLGINLPRPTFQVLKIQTGSMLCQEICRVGWESDFVVIDVAGHDSGIARRAIALADTLITPVSSSFADLDLLGHFNPVSLDLTSPGCFSITVNEIRGARARHEMPELDWVVVQNRLSHAHSLNRGRIEVALQTLASASKFRLARGLSERVAYRELFLLGLTHMDLRHIPQLSKMKPRTSDEVALLIAELRLDRPREIQIRRTPREDLPTLELRPEWLETTGD